MTQNKRIWDVEDQQLNVLEIVVGHCVDEHIEDDTLCRLDVDLIVVEKSIVHMMSLCTS